MKKLFLLFSLLLVIFVGNISAGTVCIPGLGCFSGVSGYFDGIATAWLNPGFLYTYHSILEKNAIGFQYSEKFPKDKRWGYLHIGNQQNYFGIAANRSIYRGGNPFDTTYFKPRGKNIKYLLPYIVNDSIKSSTYIIDVLWARKALNGGIGVGVHYGTNFNEDDYYDTYDPLDTLLYGRKQYEQTTNAYGLILGLDDKNLYATVGFDIYSKKTELSFTDTILDETYNSNFENSYTQIPVNFQYKHWTSLTSYYSFPKISLTYEKGNEKFSAQDIAGIQLNPEKDVKTIMGSVGISFDNLTIRNSLGVGFDFSYSNRTEDYKNDTIIINSNQDTLKIQKDGSVRTIDYTFPQIYFATKSRIWSWLSADGSVSYSSIYSTIVNKKPYLYYPTGSINPEVKTFEVTKSEFKKNIEIKFGLEINIEEYFFIDVDLSDRFMWNTPYLLSGAMTLGDYFTSVSIRYQF